ncbi:MAG TPA: ABC transporter ATP-binding protein [Ktedonobacteraceae bacterium]|nr:ABC transporter ATP-binding protein [Ktedonobacteraceae bacterium]
MIQSPVANNPDRAQTDLLLSVNNVSVDYLAGSGVVHAVNDVSFTLKRGEILGLAGESGCGKSTLAYAVARMLRPPAYITGGQVLYYPRSRLDEKGSRLASSLSLARSKQHGGNGARRPIADDEALEPVDVLQMGAEELRSFRWSELSIVFQSAMNALNPVMNIGRQITDVLRAHRPQMGPDERKQRALELLRLVGIAPDRITSYPHQLSGGMRQRAIIAIALALNPELIIMDEPTTALDVVVQREILTEIIRLREEFGFSVIFITHDLSLLLELADKVAIMYAGRIVEKAANRDLYRHPRHPYSYGLLHSFPSLHGPRTKAGGIPGSPPDLRAIPSGCPFHPRCPLVFSPCSEVRPELAPSTAATPQQLVACHLSNPTYRPEGPPTQEELGEGYRALLERSQLR